MRPFWKNSIASWMSSGVASPRYSAAARRVRHAGDRRRSDDPDVAHVRQRRDAVADVHVGERVLERRDDVVDRSVETLDEADRHTLRPGADVDRRRTQLESVRAFVLTEVGLAHRRADVEQGHALAVDRHIHLLGNVHRQHRVAAEETAERLVVHRGFDHVVAVGREDVHDGDAAARAHRRAVDVPHLRHRPADLVGDGGRAGIAVADREAADLARCAQVAFHQRRREALDVGDVVEAGADRVGRQERAHVDVDADHVADRARVLGAVQALEWTPAGIGIERCGGVDFCFERGDERAHRLGVGTPRRRRRHHARAQLADHLLADVRVLLDLRCVKARQRESARFPALAVTAGAVLLDELILGVDRKAGGGM
ncbi:MAG: hypothetical protein AUH43_21880 [Acidobacteria bacterium 13_1_40CM_65_14]|nr:MAG: hypothetical protein AUH43_21880 [Acidobacteria bacterium 13_1_40CM_65_14]